MARERHDGPVMTGNRSRWFPFGFCFSLTAALFLGFFLPHEVKRECFIRYGFGLVFAGFFLWILASRPFQLLSLLNREWRNRHQVAIGAALFLTAGIFFIAKPEYRTLADEALLTGVSATMYEQHAIICPSMAFFVPSLGGAPMYLSGDFDKRPLAFPFFVYLIHTLVGYSPNNPFVVNGIAGFFTLFLFYYLLQRWFSRFLGMMGMLVLATFPIIAILVTSRSFEIPNIAFALLAFLLLDLYVATTNLWYLELLGFSLVILAQIRYESAIFPLCFFPVILFQLWKNGWDGIRKETLLIPLLLLPVPWQRLTMLDPTTVFQVNPGEIPWGAFNLRSNLTHAVRFFSGNDSSSGMIPGVAFAAVIGLLLGGYWIIRNRQRLTVRFLSHLSVGGGVVILHAAILGVSSTGNLTVPAAMRLGIIFIPFLVFLGVFVLSVLSQNGNRMREPIFVGCLALFFFFWPGVRKKIHAHQQFFVKEFCLVNSYLEEHYPKKDVLLIANLSNFYLPHRWSSVTIDFANKNHQHILDIFRRKMFAEILFLQTIEKATGRPVTASASTELPRTQMEMGHDISAAFLTEPVYETHFYASYSLRLSRLISAQPASR
jgi:hypothetical protein